MSESAEFNLPNGAYGIMTGETRKEVLQRIDVLRAAAMSEASRRDLTSDVARKALNRLPPLGLTEEQRRRTAQDTTHGSRLPSSPSELF